MPSVVWYFDFVSPYAYVGLHALRRLPEGTDIVYRPVLFAGLLNHFGQKGPAEIAPKRKWTYRDCIWRARQASLSSTISRRGMAPGHSDPAAVSKAVLSIPASARADWR